MIVQSIIVLVALIVALLAVVGGLVWFARDYRGWTALGEGGIPHGLAGWWRMNSLRRRLDTDPIDTSCFELAGRVSALADLPQRDGARPAVAPYSIPHRQAGGNASAEVVRELCTFIDAEAERRADEGVYLAESGFEKHHDALFSTRLRDSSEEETGEVAHVHQPQGTLHVNLTASDAKIVIERGWGELHGLAGKGWRLPKHYTLLYLPRTPAEIEAVKRIVGSALDQAALSDPSEPRG